MSADEDTRLRMQAGRTVLDGRSMRGVVLEVGPRSLAAACFRRDPPAPRELERAIELVEEALMAAGLAHVARDALVTDDPLLHRTLGGAGMLTRDEVEARFERLAAASQGQAVAAAGVPMDRDAAAALLLLRECMHHLDYQRVLVESPGPDPAPG